MQGSEIRNGRGDNGVWTLGSGNSLSRLRHIQSARSRLRETGEICNCRVCGTLFEGMGTTVKTVAPIRKDGDVPGSGVDEAGTGSLPYPDGERSVFVEGR